MKTTCMLPGVACHDVPPGSVLLTERGKMRTAVMPNHKTGKCALAHGAVVVWLDVTHVCYLWGGNHYHKYNDCLLPAWHAFSRIVHQAGKAGQHVVFVIRWPKQHLGVLKTWLQALGEACWMSHDLCDMPFSLQARHSSRRSCSSWDTKGAFLPHVQGSMCSLRAPTRACHTVSSRKTTLHLRLLRQPCHTCSACGSRCTTPRAPPTPPRLCSCSVLGPTGRSSILQPWLKL